jgi:hypothetical protein
MRASLLNATAALARANKKLGMNATIGTVMVDQEGWGSSPPAVVTHNNDLVYNATASVLGKDVNIQYYGRGMSSLHDGFANGYWEPSWYTMNEIDNRQLSVPMYTLPERSTMRLQYQRTVARMLNVSAACKRAAEAKHDSTSKSKRWCPTEVVPWISLGAGYQPPATDPASGHYPYAVPWAYPAWYSWELGRDINNATARPVVTGYYEWAKTVVFYPSAFDQRSPPISSGGMTTMLLHFIAYCRGAAGIEKLPDMPDTLNGVVQ